MFLESRALWTTAPPEPRSRAGNWPTVLFSWWCTCFAAVIIITRVLGRKVRSSKLFREDWIMLAAIVPLFIRMILIHFVLIYGTNNVDTVEYEYSARQLYLRSIGSRLVLPARIFYAGFIWMSKYTVSEFLKRITGRIWRKRYEWTLQGIRIFLVLTFGAVVIATLTECMPFNHFWQVEPDPGPQCRQGFVQLLVMGCCDIVTDILLVAFPIPVVLSSGQNWKRKLQMVLLFALSLIMIGITATRMPKVISRHGRQQYRTVWASGEILASAFVSNGVILGSFLRDKGEKKNKFRKYSVTESLERSNARKPTLSRIRTQDSDEDLFLAIGCRPPEHLRSGQGSSTRPAPPALPAHKTHLTFQPRADTPLGDIIDGDESDFEPYEDVSPTTPRAPRIPQVLPSPSNSTTAGFHDVGNLLDNGRTSDSLPRSRKASNTSSAGPGINAYDFAHGRSPSHNRSGSAFLRNVGGRFLVPDFVRDRGESSSAAEQQRNAHRIRPTTAPIGVLGPMLERQESNVSLQDAGGLLMSSPFSNHQGRAQPRSDFPGRDSNPASSSGQHEEIELEDIGGLLSDDRIASASAARRVLERQDVSNEATTTGTSSAHQQDFDDLILHDPGGLIR
ncbi:hypothetical protein CB0940_07841 [Cercospora beticola]|uniref:Rhodopsin domain-containing protein n=1 Tax=Cercospora beticola TaxID=122368 RepID=A0A2G5H9M3_CERBT|nr:hypothetical protein CB0940_07841 [Cercospora beticola]PIA89230.1 hypothetical protein CB0940_07841 [Cercospora beticola]WPB03809.1 hypothetical protein RHO25_008453 [Cercospora beticola]CAK1357423.1 unnamed protein product [Cercospora beticola]